MRNKSEQLIQLERKHVEGYTKQTVYSAIAIILAAIVLIASLVWAIGAIYGEGRACTPQEAGVMAESLYNPCEAQR